MFHTILEPGEKKNNI